MIGTVRLFVLALTLALVALPPARAGEFSIEHASVSSSYEDGVPWLNFELICKSQSSEPATLIGYFSDGKTGQPLAASSSMSGSPWATKSGYAVMSSSSIPGFSKLTKFKQKLGVPHFAFDSVPENGHVNVHFFLDPGSNGHDLEFADTLGFEFTKMNPFGSSGKHGKFGKDSPRMFRPELRSFRDRLPDPPRFLQTAVLLWAAYTAILPFQSPIDRAIARTVFLERGRSLSFGGNAMWRMEGSSNDWRELYDQLGVQLGFLFPRTREAFVNGNRPPRRMIVPFNNLGNFGDRRVMVDLMSERVEAYSRVPALSNIPDLGRLFRQGQPTRVNRTLLLFLTARPNIR